MMLRRTSVFLLMAGLGLTQACQASSHKDQGTRYLRFSVDGQEAYGILEGDQVRQLSGDLFGEWEKTETTHALADVTILVPSKNPSKVLALAGNYKSHIGSSEPNPYPEPFIKLPSSLLAPGGEVVQPPDTDPVHYEAEVVIVIGKRARNVSVEAALDYVLGITCGNDISARTWQRNDVQWWRAKAADTFSPTGPYILSGGLQQPEYGAQGQRGGSPGSQDLRHDPRARRVGQLHQQVRDAGTGRSDFHRDPGDHQGHAAWRRGHRGNRGGRSPEEQSRRSQLTLGVDEYSASRGGFSRGRRDRTQLLES